MSSVVHSKGFNRIIKDCIYGHIRIPDLCVKFMDVPEFQRLRRVRQLGMAHYVYPSAVHTRFEHSLGVMHLTGKMVDQFRNFIEISDRTKELVQLGGMYHDIGHFAYSHLFDMFLKCSSLDDTVDPIFQLKDHEDRSIFFLRQVNSHIKLLDDDEVLFVENVILGKIPANSCTPFLFQIVCNNECGIDMDRLDYIHRDAVKTGLPAYQADYIILNACIDKDGYIAFREKTHRDISDVFETRKRMFENVYQHHTSLKYDKIYFCLLKRLGAKLFQYGERTDDFNVETLLHNSEETSDLIYQLNTRNLDHDCHQCHEYNSFTKYKPSGSIDDVRFI